MERTKMKIFLDPELFNRLGASAPETESVIFYLHLLPYLFFMDTRTVLGLSIPNHGIGDVSLLYFLSPN